MTGLATEALNAPRNARAVMASRDPAADDVDFFPTPPWGARAGAELVRRLDPAARTVWEPACGAGHMAHGLRDYFEPVVCSDAYRYDGNAIHDFLGPSAPDAVGRCSRAPGANPCPPEWAPFGRPDWVITNPPFAPAAQFAERAWTVARRGVALLLRAGFLEGVGRFPLLFGERPVTVFAPFCERLPMLKGRYDPDTASAAFYAWFVWLKPELRPQRFMVRIGGEWRPGVEPIAPGARQRLFRRSDLRFAIQRARGPGDVGGVTGATGEPITDRDIDLLAKVAREGGPGGVTPLTNVYPHGRLATLRSLGLLEKTAPDRIGDSRFLVSDAGRELLIDLGRIAA